MSMEKQVKSVTRSAYHKLHTTSRIRYLIEDVTRTLVISIVTFRLEYCISLPYGLHDILLKKLQKVQNTSAGIINRIPYQNHITLMLKELHWLSIKYHMEYKLLLITYTALNDQAPSYMIDVVLKR